MFKIKEFSPEERKKINIKTLKIFTFIFGFILMICVVEQVTRTPEEQAKMDEQQAEIDRENSINHHFSGWDGSHIALAIMIKNSLNDPDSYEHVDTRYNDNGATLLVQTKFRGRNVFGGMILETVVADTDAVTGKVLEIVSHE